MSKRDILLGIPCGIVLGALAIFWHPIRVNRHEYSPKRACIANLKQIDGAKQTWALEQKKVPTQTPAKTDLYGTDKYFRDEPFCPASGTYTINPVGKKPTCSVTDHTI